jgi:hypothetical protein
MFRAPELVFGGTECVESRFHVLRSRTHFWRYKGRRVSFSCFAPKTRFRRYRGRQVPFFMFCAPGLVFDGTKGVLSRFHVFRSGTCFWRYRGSRVPFSCIVLPNSFSAVPRASGAVFMFCALKLIFGSTEGVRSYFNVWRTRTHFWRYRGRRVLFSYFALPDSFSLVSRASGPIFMFCAPGHVFGGTEGVLSRFHVLRSRICFWWYRGRQVPISRIALPDSFSAVPSALGPFFMICAPRLIFDGTKGVGCRFHVLRS